MNVRRLLVDDTLPISVADAKRALRIDHGFEDAILARKLAAAVEIVEERTGRYLRPVELEVSFDYWPCWRSPEFALPVWPVRDVLTVEYIADGSAVRTAVSSSLFAWRGIESSAEVYFFSGFGYPTLSGERRGPVVVTVEAGYSVPSDPVETDAELRCPDRVIELVLLLAGHWMKNREATTSGTLADVPFSASLLFEELRIFR